MAGGLSSATFWVSAGERAAKTFAQTFLAILSAGSFGLVDAPWLAAASTAGMAVVLSFLTSIASSGVGPDGSPSLVGEPPTAVAEDPPVFGNTNPA